MGGSRFRTRRKIQSDGINNGIRVGARNCKGKGERATGTGGSLNSAKLEEQTTTYKIEEDAKKRKFRGVTDYQEEWREN